MSVRKIAKVFQGYLHLIIAMRKHILPYSKRCIIHSSVNNFKGMGTDRRLVILCDSHNLFIDSVNLRRFCCRLSECLYFSDFSLKRFCFPFQPFQIRIRLAHEIFCPCFRVGSFPFPFRFYYKSEKSDTFNGFSFLFICVMVTHFLFLVLTFLKIMSII